MVWVDDDELVNAGEITDVEVLLEEGDGRPIGLIDFDQSAGRDTAFLRVNQPWKTCDGQSHEDDERKPA